MELEQAIEAFLFYKGEPVLITELCKVFERDSDSISGALSMLQTQLQNRGIRLLQTDAEVVLVTAPESASLLETARRDEMKRDIGKAGAEALAIILYRGPVTRPEIDYIRGVNSSFILRNLLLRGLIERAQSPKDQRTFQYSTSALLLEHLGTTDKTSLPEFSRIQSELDAFEKEQLADEQLLAQSENDT